MELFKWTLRFVKYKDAVKKTIKSIEEHPEKSEIEITEKNGVHIKYLCFDNLDGLDIKNLHNEKIVCLNQKNNLEWLIKNWKSLINTKTTFLFVNPEISEKWVVNPSLHNSIIEKSSLKSGLVSLFESVPEV